MSPRNIGGIEKLVSVNSLPDYFHGKRTWISVSCLWSNVTW